MISYKYNSASERQIKIHLDSVSEEFSPVLSSYVNIREYTSKIRAKSDTFEAWYNDTLVGLLSVYQRRNNDSGYITSVSLDNRVKKQGIASTLLNNCLRLYNK